MLLPQLSRWLPLVTDLSLCSLVSWRLRAWPSFVRSERLVRSRKRLHFQAAVRGMELDRAVIVGTYKDGSDFADTW